LFFATSEILRGFAPSGCQQQLCNKIQVVEYDVAAAGGADYLGGLRAASREPEVDVGRAVGRDPPEPKRQCPKRQENGQVATPAL
jgi:hypothetical protein